ncbi:phage tail tape measure protein [Desulfobotulus sp. H1]|uniref:Phage tail tape measure protein n=1 Tax=Desulfobotulus pelophilus TaxID=2823377 RepID=A0ABT3ND87_9BACT|nr:phage tail tape measure protein [Desulfobotulus pelophilus]MCW7755418.1 phage tail tape measure protein [Desulfobotulus pelophilus]
MSNVEKIVKIIFSGDDQVSQVATGINTNLGKLGMAMNVIEDGVRSVTKPMAAMADATLTTTAALGAMAAAGTGVAIAAAGEWSDSFNEISTLIDATGDDLGIFRKNLLDYGADSAFAMAEVNAATYAAISAGTDYKDAIGLIAQTERLAIAGKAELADTTVALVSTMNAYGASADEASRYSDILFNTVKSGQTTLPELSKSLSQATSIAAAGDVPFETLAAAIAVLTAKGMPTSEAMTAIRGAIQAIIKPTEQAAREAEALGIGFDVSALKSKGFEGVMQDVYAATDGNVETIARLFGSVQGLTGVLAMFGADGGDHFLSMQQQMRASSGATDDAYGKMVKNISFQNQQLLNSMRATFVTAGLPLLDEYGDAVSALSEIFGGLRTSIDAGAFDELYARLSKSAGEFTEWASGIGQALPEALDNIDWSRFTEGVDELTETIKELFGALFQGLDPTKPDELGQILQVLVDGMGSLATVSSGVLEAWNPLLQMAGRLMIAFAELDPATAKTTGEFLGQSQMIEKLSEKFGFWGGMLIKTLLPMRDTEAELDRINVALAGVGVYLPQNTEKLREMAKATDETAKAMEGGAGSVGEFSEELEKLHENAEVEIRVSAEEIQSARDQMKALGMDATHISDDIIIDFLIHKDEASWDALKTALADIPEEKATKITAEADEASAEKTKSLFDIVTDDRGITITMNPDRSSLEAAKKVIEGSAPDTKAIEMIFGFNQAQTESTVKALEAMLGSMDNMVEWEAKLEIAEVEANAKKVEAIVFGLSNTISSTGQVMTDLFKLWDTAQFGSQQHQIESWIREELRIRKEAHEKQLQMSDAEMRLMDARADRYRFGDPLISVSGDGLQPHLQQIMLELFSQIQMSASKEYQEFLFGGGGL